MRRGATGRTSPSPSKASAAWRRARWSRRASTRHSATSSPPTIAPLCRSAERAAPARQRAAPEVAQRDHLLAAYALDRGEAAEHRDRARPRPGTLAERVVAAARLEQHVAQPVVAAEMAALALLDPDALDSAEIAHDDDLVGRRHRPGLVLVLPDLDAAAAPVEGEMVAFDRHVAIDRIGDLDAVLVADRRTHRVEDVDILAEDAGIAHITVLARGILVEHLEQRVLADVEIMRALAGMRAGAAALAAERPVLAVVAQAAEGGDRSRIGFEIPVEQVEMMRRLVDEEAGGIFHLGMPAAEIIGAVAGIEIPVEIDRGDLADDAGAQQLLDPHGGRRIAVVERDVDATAGARLGIEDAAALLDRGRHRLFGDDVGAGLERRDDIVVVIAVARADDDEGGTGLAQHRGEIGIDRGGDADRIAHALGAQAIGIAKPDQLDPAAIAGDQPLAPHVEAAMTGPDQRGTPARFHPSCHALWPIS